MLLNTPRRRCFDRSISLLPHGHLCFPRANGSTPVDLLLAASIDTSNLTTASAVCRSLPSSGHFFSPCYSPLSPLPATAAKRLSFGFSGIKIPPSGQRTNHAVLLVSLHLRFSPAILVPARTLRSFSLSSGFTPFSALKG